MGERCITCGTNENLEIDCKDNQGDSHHKMEWSQRVSFYRVQLALDNLQLLCEKCHSKKSKNEHPNINEYQPPSEDNPF